MLPTGFQSTPPCGGDTCGMMPTASGWNFNPRPLAGATLKRSCHFWKTDFNPRPLAGATRCYKRCKKWGKISIHAPLRGRHGQLWLDGDEIAISIHAPLRGRRRDGVQ